MTAIRKVDVSTAGCPACADTVGLVKRIACPSCDVAVLNVTDTDVARRVAALGLRSLPAVVVDGVPAACRVGRAPNERSLRAAGLGRP